MLIRDSSIRIAWSIFLFFYQPRMKPSPSQPYPGRGYLCKACAHCIGAEYSLPRRCAVMQEYYEDGDMVHIHPDLIALTPRGKHFSLIRFNCDNSPEPDPVFGKDYTERCNYFEQDWDNDDYNGIDLACEAHAFCKFEPPEWDLDIEQIID